MKITKSSVALVVLGSALLSACGGGGNSLVPNIVIPVTAFPLQSALNSYIANGYIKTLTVSGSCTGTGSRSAAAATTATTFEGKPALASSETLVINYTNCTPAAINQPLTSYYNTSYAPMGVSGVGVYNVYATVPTVPTSVAVGNSGVFGTENFYTDSTKVVGNGRMDQTYLIEAETATTALVNLIGKTYNASGVLATTEQDRFRIAATGALVPVSIDVVQATPAMHIVYTYQ